MMEKRKIKILKIACSDMLTYGIEHVSLQHIASKTGLDENKMKALFPGGDREIQMDAVEYAGESWVSEIKKAVHEDRRIEDKLTTLANSYTLGSKEYPASLSTYIDLWKMIKDNQDAYMKTRLKSIYNYYISACIEMIETEIGCGILKQELRGFATLITILSDVIHIQSTVLDNEVDFENLACVISRIAKQFLLGDKS